MLKSSSCYYSNAYIFVKGRIIITGTGTDAVDKQIKEIMFKNCAPFINCKTEITNTEIYDAKDIDLVMAAYNFTEYSENYFKTSISLWQYYWDEPNDNLTDSESFKSKIKITGKTPADGDIKDLDIVLPLK